VCVYVVCMRGRSGYEQRYGPATEEDAPFPELGNGVDAIDEASHVIQVN
jgi:hypothetical protein